MSSIASELGLTVGELAAYNGIENPDLVSAGVTLQIPAAAVDEPPIVTDLDQEFEDAIRQFEKLDKIDRTDFTDEAKALAQATRGAVAQAKGMDIQQYDTKKGPRLKIYGTGNEVLDLPNAMRGNIGLDNPRLNNALGYSTTFSDLKPSTLAGNIAGDYNPVKAGGGAKLGSILNIATTGFDVYQATDQFRSGEINDIQYAGKLGNIGTKVVTTTVATTAVTAGVLTTAATLGVSIAAAPVVITVATAALIGYGVSELYDWAVTDNADNNVVTQGFSDAYKWATSW